MPLVIFAPFPFLRTILFLNNLKCFPSESIWEFIDSARKLYLYHVGHHLGIIRQKYHCQELGFYAFGLFGFHHCPSFTLLLWLFQSLCAKYTFAPIRVSGPSDKSPFTSLLLVILSTSVMLEPANGSAISSNWLHSSLSSVKTCSYDTRLVSKGEVISPTNLLNLSCSTLPWSLFIPSFISGQTVDLLESDHFVNT